MHNQTIEATLTAQNTTTQGLSQQEAAARLATHGLNELRQGERTPLWRLIADAWKDPMMIILAIIVVVKAVLGEFVEAIVILAVLVVNSLISVVQTRKAESSLEALRKISAPVAKVRRGGEVITIAARELVPGDIILLDAGDFVPADGRITLANSLKVDEGLLTGESEPVLKHEHELTGDLPLGDRKNMVYSGTIAVYGRGEFVVTATGKQAEIGKIAALIETAQDKQTPIQRKLDDFSKKLGFGIMAICVVIFAVQIGRAFGGDGIGTEPVPLSQIMLHAFLFAVAVAVAAIPEALSSIVTIVLAVGTKKMAMQNAIIRKLPAVEALGSTGVICTDKTGTLTQNKMTVVGLFLPGGATFKDSLLPRAMALCNDAVLKEDGTAIGDPTEAALLAFCDVSGMPHKEIQAGHKRVAELPFDSDRKLMTVVCTPNGGQESISYTKGAPDVLFSRCTHVLMNGEIMPLTAEVLTQFEEANTDFSGRALRVLAYAMRDDSIDRIFRSSECETDGRPKAAPTKSLHSPRRGELRSPEQLEQSLTLIGLSAMIDPPRPEVYASISQAKAAHIKTVMITGDHKNTACAIAREIGIFESGHMAVTGTELDAMTEVELDQRLEDITVYARVSPENKIAIVRAWQRKGFITAMTGDGVNDAPSLKQADIGVAMGSGTEVAKDAAAMVLTDDNFTSIVNAVAVGRAIFDNIKKAVGYLFSGNLAAIIAIFFAFVIGWDSPLTALQILFINLVNDSIPAIALGLEKGEAGTMSRPPRNMNEGILGGGLLTNVITRGILIGIATIAAQFVGIWFFSPAIGGTMAFSTLILARTLQTFSSRSVTQNILQLGFLSNKYVAAAVAICLGLYASTILPGVRDVFHICESFGMTQFAIAAGLALAAVVVMECSKLGK